MLLASHMAIIQQLQAAHMAGYQKSIFWLGPISARIDFDEVLKKVNLPK